VRELVVRMLPIALRPPRMVMLCQVDLRHQSTPPHPRQAGVQGLLTSLFINAEVVKSWIFSLKMSQYRMMVVYVKNFTYQTFFLGLLTG
jgi:hypothetical protein